MTPDLDPTDPDALPVKQPGESDAAYRRREADWIAGRAEPSSIGTATLGIPAPSMKYGAPVAGGARLGGFQLERMGSLPAPRYSSPTGSEGDTSGGSDPFPIQVPGGESDGFGPSFPAETPPEPFAPPRDPVPATRPGRFGPSGAIAPGLRAPRDPTPDEPERLRVLAATGFDVRWGTPGNAPGLAWSPSRYVYEPTPDSAGVPSRYPAWAGELKRASEPQPHSSIGSGPAARALAEAGDRSANPPVREPHGLPPPSGAIGGSPASMQPVEAQRLDSSSAAIAGNPSAPADSNPSYPPPAVAACRFVEPKPGAADPKTATLFLSIGAESSIDLAIGRSHTFKTITIHPCEAIGIAMSCLLRYAAVLQCGCANLCASEVEINPRANVDWRVTSPDVPSSGTSALPGAGGWPSDIERDLWLGCIGSAPHLTGDQCGPARPSDTASGAVILYVPPPINLAPAGTAPTVRRISLVATIGGPSIGGGGKFSASLTISLAIKRVAAKTGDQYEVEPTASLTASPLDPTWSPATPDCGCRVTPPQHVDVTTVKPQLLGPASLDAPSWNIVGSAVGVSRTTKVTCAPTRGACTKAVSKTLAPYDVAIEYSWEVTGSPAGSIETSGLQRGVGLDAITVGCPATAPIARMSTVSVTARVAGETSIVGRKETQSFSVRPVVPRVIAAMAYGAGPRPSGYKAQVMAAATAIAGGDASKVVLRDFDGAMEETDAAGKPFNSGRGTVPKGQGFPNVFYDPSSGRRMAKWIASELLSGGANQFVFIVGHSLGGNSATQAANELAAKGIGVDELLLIDRLYHGSKDFGALYDADQACISGRGPCAKDAPDGFPLSGDAADLKTGVVHVIDLVSSVRTRNLEEFIYRFTGPQRPTSGGRSGGPNRKPIPIASAHNVISGDPAAYAATIARWSSSASGPTGGVIRPVNSCRGVLAYLRGRQALGTWISTP